MPRTGAAEKGERSMRRAVVDMGSNTMRMEVYDEENGKIKHIASAKEVVGMLGYMRKGSLSEDGILRIVDGLRGFHETARAIGVEQLCCFATAGLRAVKNTEDVVRRVWEQVGMEIDVISGEEEARLDFKGAYIPQDVTKGLVVDMGGGSTEIVRFSEGHIENCISLPYGSLSIYKQFIKKILPTRKELRQIREFADGHLECLDWLKGVGGHVCLIGGTGRAIVRLHRDFNRRAAEPLQGYTFQAADIDAMMDWIQSHPRLGAKRILKVDPDRVHTILPGMMAISRLVHHAGSVTVSLSRSGVREGYIRSVMADDTKNQQIQ